MIRGQHVPAVRGQILLPLAPKAEETAQRAHRQEPDQPIRARFHPGRSIPSPERAALAPFATLRRVKTLVITEKPSVARDIVDALPGSFDNNKTFYEGDDYVVTFAVGPGL